MSGLWETMGRHIHRSLFPLIASPAYLFVLLQGLPSVTKRSSLLPPEDHKDYDSVVVDALVGMLHSLDCNDSRCRAIIGLVSQHLPPDVMASRFEFVERTISAQEDVANGKVTNIDVQQRLHVGIDEEKLQFAHAYFEQHILIVSG